ncbi:glycosyltransferase WbsX family protein [Paenibacillus typhae]|uniref:glycosyltransferase WbsX family protein n=1 Tax=Paenibacillus typhae TaxID=1174501 RepID=UPI001C8DAB21|nr:glycoside hydrolase family 99-like domain-containing protein [Paenibacillus typhae]MBY0013626.1 glycoside hydrolase family 99-like domain-containing protein [Paenibacillus typhae]
MTNILAMYLPQYHEIPENNEWWGKGHTEWESCKKATSLYKGQYQPRIPLDNNYYNLLDVEAQINQAKLAKEYGVYGFCYYHYWFCGKQLLEQPINNMLNNKNIDLPFCVSWANHSWSNSTARKNRTILIKQTYGGKADWIEHFNYLKKLFVDERYIKVNNKPMLVIYDAANIECWDEMKSMWDELAIENGWEGIYYVTTLKHEVDVLFSKEKKFDAQFEYQPTFALAKAQKLDYAKWYNFKRLLCKDVFNVPCKINYDRVWKRVQNQTPDNNVKTFLGAYNDWDTTARWGKKGIVHIGASPAKFKKYLETQLKRSEARGNEFLFITAWNEWSEGAYLEPDMKNGYSYLEVIKELILSYKK